MAKKEILTNFLQKMFEAFLGCGFLTENHKIRADPLAASVSN